MPVFKPHTDTLNLAFMSVFKPHTDTLNLAFMPVVKPHTDTLNLAFMPVFKPHTDTLYILRHCTNIVYIYPDSFSIKQQWGLLFFKSIFIGFRFI
jgi:hypothetical protein